MSDGFGRWIARLRKSLPRLLAGLAVTALVLGHVSGRVPLSWIDRLENVLYDARLNLTLPGGIDPNIVILDIDEKSLALPELGRWPWGQDKMAAIVNTLFDRYQIKMVGFDSVWAEKDRGSGLEVLQQLAQGELKDVAAYRQALDKLSPRLDHEAQFAQALKDRPVVMGFYFNSAADALESGVLPDPSLPAGAFDRHDTRFPKRTGFGANLASLMASASLSGHFNPTIDPDGVIRRVPMYLEYKGQHYESLSLAMVRLLIGIEHPEHTRMGHMPDMLPGVQLLPDAQDLPGMSGKLPLEAIGVGPLQIPVDDSTQVLIPYRGPPGSFRYISLADVYTGQLPKEALHNKIALLGTTALGLADLRATPVSAIYPGVEVHANLIAGMISPVEGTLKAMPGYVRGLEWMAVLVLGVALALLMAHLSPSWSLLLVVLSVGALGYTNYLAWQAGLVLPMASLLVLILTLYVVNMAYGYLVEARSKRQFTELFGQYVPPELVDKMAEDPEKYSMAGKKETLTVLFSDVVGFTSISERLSPQDLAAFINEYLTSMSQVIREEGGTLDKYIGDAIMAFWGAPVPDANHATRAVTAALRMQRGLQVLREEFARKGWPSISIGIGLSSGEMTVGDMGSKVRKAYTVMGDTVNLGSRLEGITRQYGVGILVSEETVHMSTGVVYREIDSVRVKGKDIPIRIYQPWALEPEVDAPMRQQLDQWHQALAAYRLQHWDEAHALLASLQQAHPEDKLWGVYLERVADYRLNPPGADWDGVKKFDSK
jgi:adenylate cyclase